MLPDILTPELVVVFVGTAKGDTSARVGHYYADGTNRFWELLQATGLTGGALIASRDDQTVLQHRVGLTDLVPARAASSDALLGEDDYDVPGFIAKVERFEPVVVAFNGKEAAKKVARHVGREVPSEGPAGWTMGKSLVYRLPSSSGANAREPFAAKLAKWAEFGGWVADQERSR